MRLRVSILLGLMVCIIALVYLASRKSTPAVETTAVTNVPSAPSSSFRKIANESATAATELAQPAPPPGSNLWQRLADGEDDFQLSSEQWAEYLRQFVIGPIGRVDSEA